MRVAAVQKNAQAKLITVAEIKQRNLASPQILWNEAHCPYKTRRHYPTPAWVFTRCPAEARQWLDAERPWGFPLTTLFANQLSRAGLRNVTNRTMHLMRNTAAIRAGAHTSLDTVELLGEWKSGVSACANSYLAKSQSSALPAHLALAGFKGPHDHHLGRAEVQVPEAWVDAVTPGMRDALKVLLKQHEGMKCHEKEIGAETFLQLLLYLGMVFWQNLPLKYHRYKDRYTLAYLKGINAIMQTAEYKKFAEEVLDKERRAIEKNENRRESTLDAPPRVTVEVPKASTKVYANHSIAFRDCKTCADLWNLWEQERPIINNIIQRADAKQAHSLTIQKGRLEAVARVIQRLAEEKGNLQDGIHTLQVVLEKLDAKEKSLGGRAGISMSTFIEALQGVINTKYMQNLQSTIKGRTKATKPGLKNMLDAHWQATTSWPTVQWAQAEQAGA
ncbi:hypothetical protein KSW81_004151 [Nannochloris sp. 'desiccata']|nr:hypothetical protein KSW81_004151 [Chlorella desiccata (nom. nud.)]